MTGISLLYASPNDVKRRNMWEQMQQLLGYINKAWLVAGDFNDVMSEREKRGGTQGSSKKCITFRNNIKACKLLDLGANGPLFTWKGPLYHGGQRIYERLDRSLSNEEWRLEFHEATVKVLARVDISDHHPLMITLNADRYVQRPRQFRFESAWVVDAKYKDRVLGIWRKQAELLVNLKNIAVDAASWQCHSLHSLKRKKKEIMFRLHGIQSRMYGQQNFRALQNLEWKLQEDLSVILKQEELMWLADGDRNTKYYHLKIVTRRCRNHITMIKDAAGNWIDDEDQIRGMAIQYYKQLFMDRGDLDCWRHTALTFPLVQNVLLEELDTMVSH